jgi:hypothetical protein
MESKHTPLPWKYQDVVGAGLEIFGTLPKGFHFEGTCHDADGETSFMLWQLTSMAQIMIACERWVQFETKQWKEMQEANAEFIVKSCNSYYDMLEALEKAREYIINVSELSLFEGQKDYADYDLLEEVENVLEKAKGE